MPRVPREIIRASKLLNRVELASALEIEANDTEGELASRMLLLVEMLRSPAREYKQMHLSTLANKAGISYKKVVNAYKNMKRLEGIVAIAQRTPGVLADIAQDALNKEITCTACEGEGKIAIGEGEARREKKCLPCEGLGKITISGDKDARKMVLEVNELIGQQKQLTVNAQNSNLMIGDGDSLESVLKRSREQKEAASGTHRIPPAIEAPDGDFGEDRESDGDSDLL